MRKTVKVVLIKDEMRSPQDHLNQIFKNENNVLSYLTDEEDIVKANGYFKAEPYHLYFLSNEGSDEGEWTVFTDVLNETIEAYNRPTIAKYDYAQNGLYNFKVVASSDSTLGLPLISKWFIKEFINSNGEIKEAYLEFKFVTAKHINGRFQSIWDLKTNANNEVIHYTEEGEDLQLYIQDMGYPELPEREVEFKVIDRTPGGFIANLEATENGVTTSYYLTSQQTDKEAKEFLNNLKAKMKYFTIEELEAIGFSAYLQGQYVAKGESNKTYKEWFKSQNFELYDK